MKGFFITGTDTNVGKTIVSLGLSLALQSLGLKNSYMKPIETGIQSDNSGDAALIKNTLKIKENIKTIRPFKLSKPLAPATAFNIENKTFNINTIIHNYKKLEKNNDVILVEGAGGITTPITNKLLISDIPKILNIPIIIVIANKLGAINHTLLTLHYATTMKLNISCCILNNINNQTNIAENTNYKLLKNCIPHILQNHNTIPIFTSPFIHKIKEINKQNFTEIANYLKIQIKHK